MNWIQSYTQNRGPVFQLLAGCEGCKLSLSLRNSMVDDEYQNDLQPSSGLNLFLAGHLPDLQAHDRSGTEHFGSIFEIISTGVVLHDDIEPINLF